MMGSLKRSTCPGL